MNVSINASENGLLLFVLPTQPLVAGSRYVLTLTADITDTSGNALEAVSFEFTTVSAPAISAVTPTEGPVGTAVTIELRPVFEKKEPRSTQEPRTE